MIDRMLLTLLRLWNGKEKLSFAFWGVFVPVSVIAQLVKYVVRESGEERSAVVLGLIVLVILVCKIFSLVSVWRCAPNVATPDSPLPLLSRIVVVVSLAPVVLVVAALMAAALGS
jgi:hypothetical protein